MEELGKYLKQIRESKNLSLEEVAESTKIHIYKLMAIEKGDKAALPAKVFCIGLIKSYARQLQADMTLVDKYCSEAFQEEVVISPDEKPVNPSRGEEEPVESQPVGRFQIPKPVGIIISLAVIIILVCGIYLVVEKLNSYSEEEALPSSVFTQPVPIETDENPETKPNAEEKIESTEADGGSSEGISKTQDSQQESQQVVKKETDLAKESALTAVDTPLKNKAFEENNNFSATMEESQSTIVESDNKLIITALEPIRAEIVWADGFVQVMLLKSNESKTLVFSTPIKVKFNNGGAVQVSFNDRKSKVPGTFNKPIELSYP